MNIITKKGNLNKQALNYEDSIQYIYKKSEKRAWLVASVSITLLIFSWIGLFLLLPLKEIKPYVIKVDKVTGIPDVVTGLDPQTLEADKALDRYFVNNYIQLRESYTYQTIQDTYQKTQIFSSNKVAKQYVDSFNGDNALDKQLGEDGTATVKVISIALDTINGEHIASVRTAITYTDNKDKATTKYYLIRLSYEYRPQEKLRLTYRIENPIGFYVTSYQKIQENIQNDSE